MADCCESGCTTEVLCPVHQVLADIAVEITLRCEQLHHVSPNHCTMCGPIIRMVRDR